MKLTGSYKLKVKKEVVWKALNDPDVLKQCIPGCESFKKKVLAKPESIELILSL